MKRNTTTLRTAKVALGLTCALISTTALANPAGVWDVEGRDTSGTDWKGVLVLNINEKQPREPDQMEMTWLPPTRFYGYFDWKGSNGTGGREYVAGGYNYDTRKLLLGGTTLENADPNIGQARYDADSNEECTTLKGDWSGYVIPGTWAATKRKPENHKRTR